MYPMTVSTSLAREVWPSYFAPVIDLEASTIRIHEWEMRVVCFRPAADRGLRTGGDQRRQTAGRQRGDDRAVVARLERQAILARWQRLRAWCWPRSGYGTADPPRSDGRPRTGKR